MNPGDEQRPAEIGLAYFGHMSASISHELKNVLAVIHENAGLLDDLSLRADQGVPLEPERLKTICGRIARHIARGERIIGNMNRLAHSTDAWEGTVDLVEVVDLVVAVGERLVTMAGMNVCLDLPDAPVTVRGPAICLEALIWRCLHFVTKTGAAEGEIGVTLESGEDGARLRIAGVGFAASAGGEFPAAEERALEALLGAKVIVDSKVEQILLLLPRQEEVAPDAGY